MIRMGQRTRRARLVCDAKPRRARRVAKSCRGLIPTRVSPSLSPNGDPVSPAKGVFASHYVGEKFIGLFGRLATAPPLDAEPAGQQSGQTTQDDPHLIAHDDSLVHPRAVSKVRQGTLFLWNCGFCSFRWS